MIFVIQTLVSSLRLAQLEEQSNSLPKLEESLRLAQSDRDKYAELLEQLKTHKQTLQEKMEKRLQEEKRLKVRR